MKAPSGLFWYVASACAIALILLVVYLFFLPPTPGPAPVTIESIHWQIKQNPPENGTPEFVQQWINQSGGIWGFPFQVRAGGSFNVSLVMLNEESYNVYICGASISLPVYLTGSSPAFPMVADHNEDSLLTLTLSVNAGPGSVLNLDGVINAVGCGLPPSGS